MEEKRQTARLRSFKGGSIIFGLAPTVDCIIRNLSDKGAMMAVEGADGIPDEFTLLIKPEMIKRNCRLVWRKANRIGVHFIDTP
jgi:hypothetical protein